MPREVHRRKQGLGLSSEAEPRCCPRVSRSLSHAETVLVFLLYEEFRLHSQPSDDSSVWAFPASSPANAVESARYRQRGSYASALPGLAWTPGVGLPRGGPGTALEENGLGVWGRGKEKICERTDVFTCIMS